MTTGGLREIYGGRDNRRLSNTDHEECTFLVASDRFSSIIAASDVT
jgi:hypothetical protein